MPDTDTSLSFTCDIRPLFTDMDVDHMKRWMDLSDHASVVEHADAIYGTVTSGAMPPGSSGETRWTPEMCEKFKSWMEQGTPA